MTAQSYPGRSRTRLPLSGILILLMVLIVPVSQHSTAQDPTPPKIEAESGNIQAVGQWTQQSAPAASGGVYVYNNPTPPSGNEPYLALEFYGASLEILYVAGPNLGVMAIEVDGTVLRTVITNAPNTAYQQVAKIDYLSAENHTLRVYAQAGGVIGVDAFIAHAPQPIPRAELPTTAQTVAAPLSTRINCDATAHLQRLAADGWRYALSTDGRYIAFDSRQDSLIPGQLQDGASDVFLLDQQTCSLTLVSRSTLGIEDDTSAGSPAISGDGRFVFFGSSDPDLVPNDTNNESDVFVFDRLTATTSIAILTDSGTQPLCNGMCSGLTPSVSTDGRYIAFSTFAYNFVPGDLPIYDGFSDVFWRDLQTGETLLLSANANGAPANSYSGDSAMTPDGRYVAFVTRATDIIPVDPIADSWVLLYDHQTDTTIQLDCPNAISSSSIWGLDFSGDGTYLIYEVYGLSANQLTYQFCVYDMATHQMSVVPSIPQVPRVVDMPGVKPRITNDGRYIVFQGNAANDPLYGVWRYDRQTDTVSRPIMQNTLAIPDASVLAPVLSGDGRFLMVRSDAGNLIPGDQRPTYGAIYLRNLTQPVPAAHPDSLAIFRPEYDWVVTIDRDASVVPPVSTYHSYVAGLPFHGTWVMGDWDGDGDETPGVYTTDYAFYYTNDSVPTSNWTGIWIGLPGAQVMAGWFDTTVNHDCIAFPHSAMFAGYRLWAVYWTCNLTSGPTPALQAVYLGPIMGDHQGLEGETQFTVSPNYLYPANGADTLVVRRNQSSGNHYVVMADTREPLNTTDVEAMRRDLDEHLVIHYLGTLPEYGTFVMGDWDDDGYDNYGIVLQSGRLYYSNFGYDVQTWNFGIPMGLPMQVVTLEQ